uniref:Zf-CCHC domain-containing protein/DUF4219 domain-containing protein/UBN2 domain-containing protein n=1 Tax=Tanacetum cinerariifolium TaxID=118510 RepID=A0A6L2NRA1_TANCI|nr:zf-CCHC domain-containing protein/DUF4219 domain-containing protein/UBN2 domain-containing protein [Tanacetum cinerariifolium]
MKEKLRKYFQHMPPIITCAAALNSCFNVNRVDFLIESISLDLEFFDDGFASKSKSYFKESLKGLYNLYYTNFGNPTQSSQTSGGATSSKASGGNNYSRLLNGLKAHTKKARTDPRISSEYERYVNSDFVTHLHPKEFATFDVLDFEEDVFDDEVQRNEAIPLSDEEIALDARSEGTLKNISVRARDADLDLEHKQMKMRKAIYGVTSPQKLRRNIMAEGEIDNLTMGQYLALTRGNQAPGMVKPEITGIINFKIKSQFMRELGEDTFSGSPPTDPPNTRDESSKWWIQIVHFEQQDDDLRKKLANNNEAKMVLYNALPKKEYKRIFTCKTTKYIWQSLLITPQGNIQVKDNKIDLVQQHEQFTILEEESIDSSFARFNTIITSLKAIDEGKKEGIKSVALNAKKESSDDETSTSESDDEEYAMAVRNFKKFFRRKGKFVRQPREEKNLFQQRDENKGKSDQKCFRCGDPNHLIGDCPKPSHNKDQKAFK